MAGRDYTGGQAARPGGLVPALSKQRSRGSKGVYKVTLCGSSGRRVHFNRRSGATMTFLAIGWDSASECFRTRARVALALAAIDLWPARRDSTNFHCPTVRTAASAREQGDKPEYKGGQNQ